MGCQSVVIRAEKGKFLMLVDGKSSASQKELVYDGTGGCTDRVKGVHPTPLSLPRWPGGSRHASGW